MPRKPKAPEQRSRGQIIPRGEGKWLVRFYIGQDSAGKRKYSSKTVEGTYKQAQQALTKKLGSVDTGTFVEPQKISLTQYLTGAKLASELDKDVTKWGGWMASLRNVGPKTLRSYGERVAKDILPFLGTVRLDTLHDQRVVDWVSWMVEERKLSPRTIQYSLVVLKYALEAAVRKGMLGRNAAAHAKTPKLVRSEMKVLSPEQISLFLEKTKDSPLNALWFTLLTAGLRPQEALALQWNDIDIQTTDAGEFATLKITKAMVEVTPGHREIGPTKTERWRNVGIPSETLQVLKGHKIRQSARILKMGAEYQRDGFIFAGRTGAPLDLSAVRRRWKAELEAAGLPEVKLYGTRHSHFTALLAAGVHPKLAADRAGHSSTKQTLDTYSHVLKAMQQETTGLVGDLLFRKQQAM